jgi:hypothetical protein
VLGPSLDFETLRQVLPDARTVKSTFNDEEKGKPRVLREFLANQRPEITADLAQEKGGQPACNQENKSQ